MGDACMNCGTAWPFHHLDAKPDHLAGPGSWVERLFPSIRLGRLHSAADRGFDFLRLEGPCCYGPGYVPGDSHG